MKAEKLKIGRFLRKCGFERMELLSYAKGDTGVVLGDTEITIANGAGDCIYIPYGDYDFYALIGYLIYHRVVSVDVLNIEI